MSGFEVAGVVLGSLPLVISAVEAYMNFLKDWGKAPSELKSIHRQLTTERAKLYNVCDLLLHDIVPDRVIELMLQDPMGPLWQAKDTNDKIQRVLQDSYGPFKATVLEIKGALDSMKTRLQIDITWDGQVEWVNKGRMTREFRKFLYRLNRKDYQEALGTISKGVSDLEVLTRLSVRLEPTRRTRTHCTLLNALRDLSTSLFRALRSSVLCSDPHDVGLELTRAPSIDVGREDEDEKVLQSVQFTVTISFVMPDGPTSKRFWDEINIKTVKSRSPAPLGPASPPSTPAAMSSSTTKKSRKIKEVTFMVAQKLSFIGSSSSPPPDVRIAMASFAQHATKVAFVDTSTSDASRTTEPLANLCVALRNAREARPTCYGHLIDKDKAERCFTVYPRGTATNSDTWSIVTLRDVLEQKNGLQPLISLKEKIRLGLVIASSILQLSKTPWLPEAPTSKHIHFFKRGQHLSYEHPFLLRNFPEQLTTSSSSPSPSGPSQVPAMVVDRNPTLFSLGIMLLEIILGSTLDALREPQDMALVFPGDERGIIRDTVTAHRLLEQRVALINPLYKVVVERCMECAASRDLDEESFRREVYNRVVLELEAILGYTSLGD